MPEEINRIVADHLSRWLFAPSEVARRQLASEGIESGVHVVGDIMLDALRLHVPGARTRTEVFERLSVRPQEYYLATVHRAENTDDSARLADIFKGLAALDLPVVFPLHPRTRKRLAEFGIHPQDAIRLLEPVGYLDMLALEAAAACVLTDSGGVQKEAYYLGVCCVTLREETEWVETVETGWNALVGTDPTRIVDAVKRRAKRDDDGSRNVYGNGRTAERIVEILSDVGRTRV